MADEWISTAEAATILGVSEATVYRSLADPDEADKRWGAGNWRTKPLTKRTIFQVRRSRAEELARE